MINDKLSQGSKHTQTNRFQHTENHFQDNFFHMLSFLKGSTTVSGVNSYYRTLAREVINSGHKVTTVIIGPHSGEIFESLGEDIGCIKSISLLNNRYRSILKLFNDTKPSVVLNHYSELGLQGTSIARFHGHTFHNIYICHSDTDDHYGIIARYQEVIDHVIAVSSTCASEVKTQFLNKYPNPLVLPAGIEIPRDCVKIPSTGPLHLIYSGRMEQRQKRVMDFIPFVQALDDLDIEYKLHLVGEGPCLKELRKVLFHKNILFHGRVSTETMSKLFTQAHVFILLSAFEGTSVSLLEAMGHGLVPLVTEIRGITDIIENGKNGFLFPISSTNDAAKQLSTIYRDRELADSIGRQARQTAKSFSANGTSSLFIKHIKSLGSPPQNLTHKSLKPFLSGNSLGLVDKYYIPSFLVYFWRKLVSLNKKSVSF